MRARRLVMVALTAALLTGCGGGAPAGSPAGTASSPRTTSPLATSPLATPPPAATPSPLPPALPPVDPPPPPAPVVVLDPGHNGGNAAHPGTINAPVPDGAGGTKACNTTGTATDAGYPEHAFTWDVAVRTRDLLAAAGVTVVLTRPDDAGVGPCVDARAAVAGQIGAAAFLSVHGDGAAPGGRGFHVITSTRDPPAQRWRWPRTRWPGRCATPWRR